MDRNRLIGFAILSVGLIFVGTFLLPAGPKPESASSALLQKNPLGPTDNSSMANRSLARGMNFSEDRQERRNRGRPQNQSRDRAWALNREEQEGIQRKRGILLGAEKIRQTEDRDSKSGRKKHILLFRTKNTKYKLVRVERTQDAEGSTPTEQTIMAADRLLVHLQPQKTVQDLEKILEAYEGTISKTLLNGTLFVIQWDSTRYDYKDVLAVMNQNQDVISSADPDLIVSI